MKKFILFLMLMCFATSAFAAQQLLMDKTYTASDSTVYVNVKNYRTKSVMVNGINESTGAFMNYSGTVTIKACTGSDPTTAFCTGADSLAGTAISFTTPGNLSWEDAFPYMQIVWAKTKHNLRVYMYGVQY